MRSLPVRVFIEARGEWRLYRQRTAYYRQSVYDEMRESMRQHSTARDVVIAMASAVSGPLLYWWWTARRDVEVDVPGLIFSAVGSVVISLSVMWAYFHWKARIKVLGDIQHFREQQDPSLQLATSYHVTEDGITLKLYSPGVGRRLQSVFCAFAVDGNECRTGDLGPVDVGVLEITYPKDFPNASWPLPKGKHRFTWLATGPVVPIYTEPRGQPFYSEIEVKEP